VWPDVPRKLSFGLVGGGEISHKHVRGLLAGGRAVFRSGCFSRNSGRNAAYAERYGIPQDRLYDDYETMASIEAERGDRPDFVVVATPNFNHYEICKTFLSRGFPVACDKPFTIGASRAEELANMSRDRGIPCCVTYTFSGNPFVRLMKAVHGEGLVGNAYYLNFSFLHGRRQAQVMKNPRSSWRFVGDLSGPAGAIGDLGSHVEYLARFIAGSDIKKVLARLVNEPGGIELDSTATVLFEAASGMAGSMQIAQLACGRNSDLSAELWGDSGSLSWKFANPDELRVDYLDGRAEILRDPGITHPAVRRFDRIPPSNADKATACFVNLYDEFMNALEARRTGEETDAIYPTFEDGAKGVRFLDACLKSHSLGNVWVDV
jgi:predicted dehydrogenase